MSRTLRRLVVGGGLVYAGVAAWQQYNAPPPPRHDVPLLDVPPPRLQALKSLKTDTFDTLVIGGGATGCGVALDCAARGIRCALVEQEDFSSGTSSRSTKLIHGGVRYLEKAVFNLDYGQLKGDLATDSAVQLVFEALSERKNMLTIAPHLARELPIMTPCYKWWEVPYYWAGLKAYDLVAAACGGVLFLSKYMGPSHSLRDFPTLSETSNGLKLKGAVVYYDGQMDDARFNVALACTAAMAGATVANYTQVVRLLKDEGGNVAGAIVKDALTGEEFPVRAKVVINATGPFADGVRRMAEPKREPMITPSAGAHITLPDYYSPNGMGLIVPKTADGRVVFMLPWQDVTIAGTTDAESTITMLPRATEEEVQFILTEIGRFLNVKVRRSDVLSVWSGIRPLASDPTKSDTQSISRDHVVVVEDDGLITVTGGKWTTYRKMAEDAVDLAVQVGGLHPPHGCRTLGLPLVGGQGYYSALFTAVAQNYVVPHRPGAIDTKVARHLAAAYGDRAPEVTKIAEERKLGQRLVRGQPFLEAEVVYAARREMCLTACDFIARRTRLAFIDTAATLQALPRIVELLAGELGWDSRRRHRELEQAKAFLATFTA